MAETSPRSPSSQSSQHINKARKSDYELLREVADIFSQQAIADTLGRPREVVNRWLKMPGKKAPRPKAPQQKQPGDWLKYAERLNLEDMLPKPPATDRSDFTFIDLFAGIGGIRKGFEGAGGRCVFTSEYDKYAVKTYKANYHSDHEIVGDIREVTQPQGMSGRKTKRQAYAHIRKVIPDHDVLLAGFPCQPFSIAGVSKKNSLGRSHGFEDDTQGTLFFDIARIIEVKKPVALMLENVKNLKSHDRGKTFTVIMNTLDKLGYEVADRDYSATQPDPKIINGKNFVPQNRERIVLVAFRKDAGGVRDLSLSKVDQFFPKQPPKVGEIFDPEEDVDPKYILTPKLWKYLKDYANKHKAAGNGFGFGKVKADDTSTRTLSARYYKDGSEILVDRGPRRRPRRLTPRECARLMGFDQPRQSEFVIPVSDTQAYKQFGNSVVVPVFAAVAKTMKPYILAAKAAPKVNPKQKARSRAGTMKGQRSQGCEL